MTNKIRELREAAGMTRPELSERSGVPKRTIDDWENERRVPRDVYQLKKVANVLGVHIDDLINWEEDVYENKRRT